MKKILMIGFCLCLSAPFLTADAQNGNGNGKGKAKGHHKTTTVKVKKHYVKMKPKAPGYTRGNAPGTNYVYIKEDWSWDPTGSTWVWNGNRWVLAPTAGQVWIPGHWRNTSAGWLWVDGYWK